MLHFINKNHIKKQLSLIVFYNVLAFLFLPDAKKKSSDFQVSGCSFSSQYFINEGQTTFKK